MNTQRPNEEPERHDRRTVETHTESPQSPARKKEGERAAKEVAKEPAVENFGEELKWIKDRFEWGCDKIESAYDDKNFDAISQRSKFAEGLVIRALKLPLVGIRKRWEAEIAEISRSGWDKKKIFALRDKYAHESTGEIAKAVKIEEYYIIKMREKSEGRGFPEILAEMTRSKNRNAEIYAQLLAEGGNKDLVDALSAVLGMQVEGKTSAASLEEAKKTIQARLEKEFPGGRLMPVLWMIMSFLDRSKKLEIGKHFKQKNPAEIEKFIEAGNLYGVFDPEMMEQISGIKYDKEKRTEFAVKWQMQNDFLEEGKTLMGSSYGSENPVNTMLSAKGIGLFIGQLVAGATIGANFLVATFSAIKGKNIAGKIVAMPGAVLDTVKNPNAIGAGVALGLIHLAKSRETLGEMLMPKGERDNLKITRGKEALRIERRGNPLWDKWNEMFMSDDFMGGKVFSDFVRNQRLNAEDEDIGNAKLEVADFLKYLDEQSKSKTPMQKTADYSALKQKVEGALAGADSSALAGLAKAFDYLEIGGATGKTNYERYLKEVEKA